MLDAVIGFLSAFAGFIVFAFYLGTLLIDPEFKAFLRHPLTLDVVRLCVLPITLPVMYAQQLYLRWRT